MSLRRVLQDIFPCRLLSLEDPSIPSTISFVVLSHTWQLSLMALNAVTAFYGPTMFFTKLTLFILYYRLFSPSKTMRYLIFFGIGFNFLFYTIYTFLYSLMCPNVSKRAQTCGPRLKAMGVATSAINVVSDFYILLIPLAAISNLQLPPKKKWGLMGIFFTGFLACLCSIISLHYRVVLDKSTDDIWNVAPVMVIGTVEFNIGIICSCLPTLPALFRRSGFSRKSKPSYMPDSGNGQFENAAHPNGGRGGAAAARSGPSGGNGKEMGRDVDESRDSVATLEEGRRNATAVDGGAFEMNGLDAEEERKREWLRQARM
ncbi:MAG: hypothetical protein Q9203_001092 [Teloschistes exilis]